MISNNLKPQSTGARPAQSIPYEEDMHSPIDANSIDSRPVAETKNIDAIGQLGTRMRETLKRTGEDIVFLEHQYDKLKEKRAKLTEELEAVTAEIYDSEKVRDVLHNAYNSLDELYKNTEQDYYNKNGGQ